MGVFYVKGISSFPVESIGKGELLMSIQASCVQCDNFMDVNFTVKKYGQLEETYFTCEHCSAHTTCFVTDNIVRDMQKKVRSLVGRDKRRALQVEINERKAKLKVELKERVYGVIS